MNKLDNKQQQVLEEISQWDLSILDLDETDLVSSAAASSGSSSCKVCSTCGPSSCCA